MTASILQFRAAHELSTGSPADTPSALYPDGLTSRPAWRDPIRTLWSGFLYHLRAAAKVRGVRFFAENDAQELTLRPRAPGLPHHRHPLTCDEALAGIVVALGLFGSTLYLLARFL